MRLAVLAGLWASTIGATGGFAFTLVGLEVSSRNPAPALFATLVFFGLAWLLGPHHERTRSFVSEWERLAETISGRVPPHVRKAWVVAIPILLSLAVAVVGLSRGALIAGGSDSYGYVSQAHLWAQGHTRVELPIAARLPWPFALEALTPLGYRPAPQGNALVPTYPPGLPLTMAAFEKVAGADAVFLVVPLLGGLAVWTTYRLGARIGGAPIGCAAAALLATSPAFLYQLMFPMSDVPAAAWWTGALTLLTGTSIAGAFFAGLSAAAAILTRPNLSPLFFLVAAAIWGRAIGGGDRIGRGCTFAGGGILGIAATLGLNRLWYGDPFRTGYGLPADLYSLAHVGPNLANYAIWLRDAETLLVVAAAIPVVASTAVLARFAEHVDRRTLWLLALLFIVTLGCYLPYRPFDAWWYLRFLLPAFPPLLILMSTGLSIVIRGLTRPAFAFTLVAVVTSLSAHGVWYARQNTVFDLAALESRYARVGEYISTHYPERSVFLSLQYSGSIRYYADRLTLRYEAIPPEALPVVVSDLARMGFRTYAVLEDWEQPEFARRFGIVGQLGRADWPPDAVIPGPFTVSIWSLDGVGSARVPNE